MEFRRVTCRSLDTGSGSNTVNVTAPTQTLGNLGADLIIHGGGPTAVVQIGRASCRERDQIAETYTVSPTNNRRIGLLVQSAHSQGTGRVDSVHSASVFYDGVGSMELAGG